MQGAPGLKAGVLLHPTSLPSARLDQNALDWIDWLAEAGFSVWQVLPLGVPQHNHSPYMCLSSFAMNPALMDEADIEACNQSLELADFLHWYRSQQYWLDDYALFMVLKAHYDGKAWFEWPEAYRQRDPETLEVARRTHRLALKAIFIQQYALHVRWQAIRNHAQSKGVALFGDLPIFVAHDSADVWANQACFLLDERGQPTYVAGVPPDYFSPTGQRWGNPQYDWQSLQSTQFDYWVKRLDYHLQNFDLLRIDHFRGLEAVWMIEASAEGAVHGHWHTVPGKELLLQVRSQLGILPLVAENLGTITAQVENLRRDFALSGMAVLQFAWDGSEDNPHLPQNILSDCVAYTGTHDNDTTAGWFDALDEDLQKKIMQQMGVDRSDEICSAFIDAALGSAAGLAVFPMQDILCLGSAARMNTPGTSLGNWGWKTDRESLSPALAAQLKARLKRFNRLPNPINHPQ